MGGVGGDTAQYYYKAELLHVGIFPHPFICMRNFITIKVGNQSD